jgi:hypothetical protein
VLGAQPRDLPSAPVAHRAVGSLAFKLQVVKTTSAVAPSHRRQYGPGHRSTALTKPLVTHAGVPCAATARLPSAPWRFDIWAQRPRRIQPRGCIWHSPRQSFYPPMQTATGRIAGPFGLGGIDCRRMRTQIGSGRLASRGAEHRTILAGCRRWLAAPDVLRIRCRNYSFHGIRRLACLVFAAHAFMLIRPFRGLQPHLMIRDSQPYAAGQLISGKRAVGKRIAAVHHSAFGSGSRQTRRSNMNGAFRCPK